MNMDEESEESEECPICMEEVEHFINLRCCRGKICPRCLNKLVSQRCPLCRGSLDALSLLSPWCRHCLKKRADCTCPPRPPVSPVSPAVPPIRPVSPIPPVFRIPVSREEDARSGIASFFDDGVHRIIDPNTMNHGSDYFSGYFNINNNRFPRSFRGAFDID